MSRIIRLPPEVVRRIAAGEVIENPASVVRELIENALDALASRIEVLIEKGGKSRIQVTDNGVGMTKEEIPLAVLRHTTSKIHREADLQAIRTLGFRGEALYAIASVSRLRIVSRVREEEVGWEGRFEGGKLLEIRPAPHPPGTTVEVRDLFHDFPARRRFLRSENTEARKVTACVTDYALVHYTRSFRLISGGRILLDLPPAEGFLKRVRDLFGEEFLEEMLPVEMRFGDSIQIWGLVSHPAALREGRPPQMVFVNGRRVRDEVVRAAVYRAFEQDRYAPAFLLHLELDPRLVDFNVHPAKAEVRFSASARVFDRVYQAVSAALETVRAQIPVTAPPSEAGGVRPFPTPAPSFRRAEPRGRQLELGEVTGELFARREEARESIGGIWQLHQTYILAEVQSGYVIVDQHAAHERVLYDRLKRGEARPQMLLFPLMLQLDPVGFHRLEASRSMLEQLGFRLRFLSGRTVLVEGVPDVLSSLTKEQFLDIVDALEERGALPDRFHRLLATVACKAAVKAGDPLSPEEMRALLDQLFATEHPYLCPHGRPTVLKVSLEELEHRFGRRP